MYESYEHATWRGTLPPAPETQEMAIFFDTQSGVVRFRLSSASALEIAKSIFDYLETDHSLMSSGIPSSPGFTPLLGENVCPPERSSAAARGE
jgi:hypothetical protein